MAVRHSPDTESRPVPSSLDPAELTTWRGLPCQYGRTTGHSLVTFVVASPTASVGACRAHVGDAVVGLALADNDTDVFEVAWIEPRAARPR